MSEVGLCPVAFPSDETPERGRVRLERTWFAVVAAGFGLLGYADMANALSFGPVAEVSKLIYVATLAAAFAIFAARRGSFRVVPPAWVLLGFTFAVAVTYVLQLALARPPNSYLAAFMPTTLYTLILVLPDPRKPIDRRSVVAAMTGFLMLLGAIYAVEISIRSAAGGLGDINNLENHVKSVSLVLAAGLAIVSGRWAWLVVIVVLAAWITTLRPSSTFILAMVACCSLGLLIRLGWMRAAGLVSYTVLLVLAVSPLVVSFVPGADELVLSFEGALKEEWLGGQTNTSVRLIVQSVALSGMRGYDWVLGEMFVGANSVYVADLLPWWWDNSDRGLATIHSDYVILLVQSGLVGYVAYNLVLLALAATGLQIRRGEGRAERELRAVFPICVTGLAIYSAANPFLQYYQTSHVVWLCLGLAQYALLPVSQRATTPTSGASTLLAVAR